jgi:hypothetical protein
MPIAAWVSSPSRQPEQRRVTVRGLASVTHEVEYPRRHRDGELPGSWRGRSRSRSAGRGAGRIATCRPVGSHVLGSGLKTGRKPPADADALEPLALRTPKDGDVIGAVRRWARPPRHDRHGEYRCQYEQSRQHPEKWLHIPLARPSAEGPDVWMSRAGGWLLLSLAAPAVRGGNPTKVG